MPNPPPEIPSVEPLQLQSVTRGIIAETEERIVHLEEMDRRSLEVRQTILRRLEEYRRFVFYQISLVAPIRRLPTELLSEIFAIYVADDIKTSSGMLRRQWSLAQVCRRWRHVVLNTPRLWNRPPRIYAGMTHEVDPSSVKTHFARAGGLPLSIDVSINLGACAKPSRLLATLINNTSVFSLAPQLRGVSFMSKRVLCGDQFSRLVLPWSQLKTITINLPNLDYAWKVFSNAPHMETCTFTKIVNNGTPHGIVRHMDLQQLLLKGCQDGPAFPIALFDTLVLPNLINLLIEFDNLTIDPITSLITRSGCSLSKLILNCPIVRGSLLKLLEETASLIHLEVHALSQADIKGLTVSKKNGNQPITPSLSEIHIANVNAITGPSSINTLIRSRARVNPKISDVKPIQRIHLYFKSDHLSQEMYGRFTGLPWMPYSEPESADGTVEWAKSLREIIARLRPPPPHQDWFSLWDILTEMEHWEAIKQPYLAMVEQPDTYDTMHRIRIRHFVKMIVNNRNVASQNINDAESSTFTKRRVIVLISQSTPNGTSNATSSSKVVKRVALDGGISHDGHDARRAAFHPLPRHVFSLKRCVVRYVYVSIVVLDSVVIPMRGS
ncbi:uncharacterized protein LACBIDRAFT_334204 [Laccaria bicolor S238N-H82]|uniref:Predicted protein n=1 Tax=Laccaria bicolor (strain S238N-H82 / ATCC MYA-4686) TaxID=486041 RepID=B0DYG3_LACBS|nr:uncharacterized protein LACBIDRAFT_334204 [Laccaria bicolor S238N-H82]EDR00380.1 predicted protein [Laccaria bicolor S238N-H82]|eukprot:XP_001888939.1 predicted protein [Laccaria bicolor S238N-H82]